MFEMRQGQPARNIVTEVRTEPIGGPPASIWDSLRQRMQDFSSAERKVARVVLTNSPTVGLETVARLAELAGVSGPTVIRFVNRLGFDSFIDFQRAIRVELDARMASPVGRYAQQGAAVGLDQVIGQHRDLFVRDLQETFDAMSPGEFQAVVDLLADTRRRIWVVGGRFSRILAQYLHLHLQQLRPNVHLLTESAADRVAAALDAGRRDVLVAFDYRRYETETIDLARAMAGSDATVVLFTDRWLSPIADVAEVVLPSIVESPSPFETLVPGLAVVEAVVAGLVGAMGQPARRRVERYAAITDRMVIGWNPPGKKEPGHDKKEPGT